MDKGGNGRNTLRPYGAVMRVACYAGNDLRGAGNFGAGGVFMDKGERAQHVAPLRGRWCVGASRATPVRG